MNKTFKKYMIINSLALIWNLIGVYQYLVQVYQSELDKMGLAPELQNYFLQLPAWVTGSYAMAVFGGSAGCIALLLRSSWSINFLGSSLLGVLLQHYYNFFIQSDVILSYDLIWMPVIILTVSISLLWSAFYYKKTEFIF
jgi:hypothetical protein